MNITDTAKCGKELGEFRTSHTCTNTQSLVMLVDCTLARICVCVSARRYIWLVCAYVFLPNTLRFGCKILCVHFHISSTCNVFKSASSILYHIITNTGTQRCEHVKECTHADRRITSANVHDFLITLFEIPSSEFNMDIYIGRTSLSH